MPYLFFFGMLENIQFDTKVKEKTNFAAFLNLFFALDTYGHKVYKVS